MTEQRSAGGLDFEALRRAREQRDADLLLSLYADDAEVRVVDRATPPGSPKVLHSKEAAEYWRDVCAREMTHHIVSAEENKAPCNRIGWSKTRRYDERSYT